MAVGLDCACGHRQSTGHTRCTNEYLGGRLNYRHRVLYITAFTGWDDEDGCLIAKDGDQLAPAPLSE
jgi:hypothetical protein